MQALCTLREEAGRSSPSGGLGHATRISGGCRMCPRTNTKAWAQGSRMGICQHGCPSPPKASVGRVSREPGRSARAGRVLPISGSSFRASSAGAGPRCSLQCKQAL